MLLLGFLVRGTVEMDFSMSARRRYPPEALTKVVESRRRTAKGAVGKEGGRGGSYMRGGSEWGVGTGGGGEKK